MIRVQSIKDRNLYLVLRINFFFILRCHWNKLMPGDQTENCIEMYKGHIERHAHEQANLIIMFVQMKENTHVQIIMKLDLLFTC